MSAAARALLPIGVLGSASPVGFSRDFIGALTRRERQLAQCVCGLSRGSKYGRRRQPRAKHGRASDFDAGTRYECLNDKFPGVSVAETSCTPQTLVSLHRTTLGSTHRTF